MMQIWAFIGMLWACIFRPGFPQDRILFPTDNRDNNIDDDNSQTIEGVPESLLLRMKDVNNATEFLRRFVIREEDEFIPNAAPQSPFNPRSSSAPGPGGQIAQFAACRPELEVVKLQKGATPAGVMLWPPCVRVKRCGGCCTSKLLACRPVSISNINVTVLQVRLSIERPDAFESDGEHVISLEQHDSCTCGCRQLPDECIAGLQQYSPAECRCTCINYEQALACVGSDRLWDSTECVCKCRHPTECSTGLFYSFRSCRCEVFRDALFAAFQPRTTLLGRYRELSTHNSSTATTTLS